MESGVRGTSPKQFIGPLEVSRINKDDLPALLFRVRMISLAFHDAKLLDRRTGEPSKTAVEAYEWITRDEPTNPSSFVRFCEELRLFGNAETWEPAVVRRQGTPQGSYGWRDTVGGVGGIRERWGAFSPTRW